MNRLLPLLLLMSALAACAKPEPPLRYLLPVPPEPARVEWLGTYAKESDFDLLTGASVMSQILGDIGGTQFTAPTGIVGDGEGRIFVGDATAGIVVIDLTKRTIAPLPLPESLRFSPVHLAIDARKQLYVADSQGGRVLALSRAGGLLKIYKDEALGRPVGVAVDERSQRLYVSDAANHHVVVFGLDGRKQFSFGKKGEADDSLHGPGAMAFAASGELYIAEQLAARVSVWKADGTFVRRFGSRDDTQAGFESLRGIQFDSEQNLWVTDFRRGAVRAFTPEGRLLFVLTGPASHAMGFANPYGLFITPDDELWVSEYLVKRVARWRYLSKSVLQKHPITDEDLARLLRNKPAGVDVPDARK